MGGKNPQPSEVVYYGSHFKALYGPSVSSQRLDIIKGTLPQPFYLSDRRKGWLRATLEKHFADLQAKAERGVKA